MSMGTASDGRNRVPRAAAFYCALVVLPCVAVLFAVPLIVNSTWFANNAFFNFVPVRDYPYEVTGMDADVVIFGDSSALAGVDPLLMQSQLGVSVVNLSPIMQSLYVLRDAPLAAYLRHNKPPRLIVIYVVPWNTGMPEGDGYTDGLIMTMRHDNAAHAIGRTLRHPVQMLNADIFLVNLILGHLRDPQTLEGHEAAWRNHGFFPYPPDRPHLSAGCILHPGLSLASDFGAWPQFLVKRYQTAQTRVALYLAPTPDCQGMAKFHRVAEEIQPRPINQWQTLAPELFLSDGFDAHPERRNVPVTTQMLIDSLRPLLTVQGQP